MNTVERIKSICKERKIAISTLEKECGFANGYIGQLRKGTIPDDRLRKISNYLDLSVDYLMTGEDGKMLLIETAKQDAALSNMDDRIKAYALKLANLPEDKKELVLKMIDQLEE